MASFQLGMVHYLPAIPPLKENTKIFEAGPLRIGVEYREINPDIVNGTYAESDYLDEVKSAKDPEAFDDEGLSIHVFDAESGFEHLRFDMFEGDPHYHYLYPDRTVTILFDVDAHGQMLEWTLGVLEKRLPAMLATADAKSLAARVDNQALADALPLVAAEAHRALATDTPVSS